MYKTLYRKYRPKNFNEIYGEDDIIRALQNSLKNDQTSHAYLFTGPRGIGKTTTARLMAKALNCETGVTDSPCNKCKNCKGIDNGNFFDLIEIDAASNRGIDKIRELKEKVNYKPVEGRKKVYIIDEVHMLTKEAFNALLKTLEEPPEYVVFVLATTEPSKILDTIISRCQRYDFKPLSQEKTVEALMEISKKENINIDIESLELIHIKSGGSLRDGISILEKVIAFYYSEDIDITKTEKALGVIPRKKLEEFFGIIQDKTKTEGLSFLDKLWSEGIDIEEFLKDFSFYIKNKMIKSEDELEIELYIEMIENIYGVIDKFKYEEDKRLLGYLILYKLMRDNKNIENQKKVTSQINRQVQQESQIEESPVETKKNNVNIQTPIKNIKKKWDGVLKELKSQKISLYAFLNSAYPDRIQDSKLVIIFPFENKFHKTSMEKRKNYDIFLKILEDFFGERIQVEFEIENGNLKKKKTDNKILDDIIDFFDGEIVDMK
ncbi:MAG: DNA polymerase III subunit gamma/tau [Fusobacteriota bacterium]